MEFPEILQPYADDLLKTKSDSIHITISEESTKRLQSKFAGEPYWLKDQPYPLGEDGHPLTLLAQINFDEINGSIEHFPTTGILQFFVATTGEYGQHLSNPLTQDNFRIIYHDTIETDESKWLMDIPEAVDDEFPIFAEDLALSFEKSEELVSATDFRFFEYFEDKGIFDRDDDLYEEIDELYTEEFYHGQGHKLGGYPFFTQDDPRIGGEYPEHLIQLLQIDTDDDSDLIMWGDSGAGHFFITKDDLINRDFSNVLYWWDCY